MSIGINSLTFNNNISTLRNIRELVDTVECSKSFFRENWRELQRLDIRCETFSSLVAGQYTLPRDNAAFRTELLETCAMARDAGVRKLMFGMARFRTDPALAPFFAELVCECRARGLILMYEAIPRGYLGNQWLCTHRELIDFTRKNGIQGVHVDFGTIHRNGEHFEEIASQCNVINVHYPFGIPVTINNDVSLENYTSKKLSEQEIIEWLKTLRLSGQGSTG